MEKIIIKYLVIKYTNQWLKKIKHSTRKQQSKSGNIL